mmetsp:Transcript_18009/g.49017  ORF Transcript_18009/g.49017 Transcript_18009/m.49017 type:complete len:214 (+) Transcript_18009:126-767(+)
MTTSHPHIITANGIVSPEAILCKDLHYLKIDTTGVKLSPQKEEFGKHFGSSPLMLATMWHDLCHANIEGMIPLDSKEKLSGLKSFFMAHYFLWGKEKKANKMATPFGVCEKKVRGFALWLWIERIMLLKEKVLFWSKALDSFEAKKIAVSIDGKDCKTWEQKHPTLLVDRKHHTKKYNHGGCKYQITMCAQRQQCVHIYGPCRGGMHDKEMLE